MQLSTQHIKIFFFIVMFTSLFTSVFVTTDLKSEVKSEIKDEINSEIVLSNKQDVLKYLSVLSKLDPYEIPYKITQFHKTIDNYFVNKIKICSGEFSKLFFLDKEKNFFATEKRILSVDEKKSCFEELQTLENNFTDVQLSVYQRYFDYINKNRQNAINQLKKEFINGKK
ncbi:MAG: hypothetical protein HQK49_09200 [Oligoflexia bacterium]|nr:hypothetical protein [Oligoflexia bacterium]